MHNNSEQFSENFNLLLTQSLHSMNAADVKEVQIDRSNAISDVINQSLFYFGVFAIPVIWIDY